MAVGTVRRLSKGNFKMTSSRVIGLVLNHPFLMVMLLFLVFLHQRFPVLFSLLVTASPVLICTAILLGTLLMHGKPNDHIVNNYEGFKYNSTYSTPRNGQENPSLSTDREGIFSKDIFAEVRKDIVEKGMRGILASEVSFGSDSTTKFNWEFHSVDFSKGSKIDKAEKGKNDCGITNFETSNLQMRLDKGYDCESDGAEKFSLDALMADVFPSAQETHSLDTQESQDLLHVETPRNDGSLKLEFESLDSNQSSEDENDDAIVEDEILKVKVDGDNMTNSWIGMENSQQLESLIKNTSDDDEIEDDVDIDEDDEEEEEDDDEGEDDDVEKDVTNNVTVWTEEDEKNLRLVGNSELERDLRLENLLARRRVKRNFSMISEKNLIDLDHPNHISFQIPHISTTRVNPFDNPHDDQEHFYSNLPIPGSAPSVSKLRKNPFDSPCISPKEVQNVTKEFPVNGSSSSGYNHQGNVLKPQLVQMNSKAAVFRRYDSFSIGHNFSEVDLGQSEFNETDRRDARLKRRVTFNARSALSNMLSSSDKLSFRKMKPIFVPEEVDKDQDTGHMSSGRESSDDSGSSSNSSESDIEDVAPIRDLKAHIEHRLNKKETAVDDHTSTHSEDSSSNSSEEINRLHDKIEEELPGSSLEVNAEVNSDQIYQKDEGSHENYGTASSSSTSKISEVDHSSENTGHDEDEIVKISGLLSKASSNVSDAITEPPVFDSSPSGNEKITPFSSLPIHD